MSEKESRFDYNKLFVDPEPITEEELEILRVTSERDYHSNTESINSQDNVRLVNTLLKLRGKKPITTTQPLPDITRVDRVMIINHSLNNLKDQPDNSVLLNKLRMVGEITRLEALKEKGQSGKPLQNDLQRPTRK